MRIYSKILLKFTQLKYGQCQKRNAISRDAVLDGALYTETEEGWSGMTVDVKYIEALPSVNPQQKTGYWIKHNTGHSIYYDCSLCGCVAPCTEFADSFIWKLSAYCPDCGAKMKNVLRKVEDKDE